jgi:hemoglobin
MKKKQINSREDIELMVDDFYEKIQKDSLLGGIFNGVIQDNWPEHLGKMYRFWETVLLDKHTYHGSPFMPHAKMPLEKDHFDQWLKLFTETLDQYFKGERAEKAKLQSQRMAIMFQSKIQYYRNNSSTSLS